MSSSGSAVPDRSNGDGPFITVVRPNDVILGRGAPASTYQGNVRFRALISERQEEYSRAERRQIKDKIAREILREIDRRRGRFLRKIESSQEERRLGVPAGVTAWVEADEDVALEKIKQALRHRDQSQSQSETSRRRADQAPAAPQAAMLPPGSAAAAAAAALVPRNLAAPASNNDLNVQLFPSLGGLAHMVPPPAVPLVSQPTSTLSQLLSNRLAHFQQEQQLREQQQLAAALLGQQQMLESQHLYRQQVLQAAAVSALAGSSIPMVNPLLSHLTPVASALWNPMTASALSAPAGARIATDTRLVGNGVGASITTASNATPSTATNPSGSSSAQSGIEMSDRGHSRAIVPRLCSNANNVTTATNDTTAVHQSVVEPQEAAAAAAAAIAPPAHTMAYVREQATTELMHLQNAISIELLARGVVLPSHNQGIATLQLPEPMNERPSSVSSTGAKSSSSSSKSKSTDSKLEDEEENRKPKAQPPVDDASSAVVQEAAAAAAPDGNKSSASSESKTAARYQADETVHQQNKKRRTSHP
jgi:hypothetical protein